MRSKAHRERLLKVPGVLVVEDRVIVPEEHLGAVLGSLQLWKRRKRGKKPVQAVMEM